MRAVMAALELAGLGLVVIGAFLLTLPFGVIAAGAALIYISRGET